jgi:Uncharacterised nucleotidyltransferase
VTAQLSVVEEEASAAHGTPPARLVSARDLWPAVGALIDAAPALEDVMEHRLHLLAARHWREQGHEVPAEVLAWERTAALVDLAVPTLVRNIRAAYDGPLLLIKGAEVAARYPEPGLRPFGDIDVLAMDAPAAHAALLRAGFVELGDPRLYVEIHHLRPLQLPALPIPIEIHSGPKWLDGLVPPTAEELFAVAVPSRVAGIDSLPAAHHALLLAVHSWSHEPLRHLLELVDVAAMAREANSDEIQALARAWNVERVWKATERAVDALFYGGRRSIPLRLWARNISSARGRTVLESHFEHWLSPFSSMPLRAAVRASAGSIAAEVRPNYGEPWSSKLVRVRLALRNARTRRAIHDDLLRKEGQPLSPWEVSDEER